MLELISPIARNLVPLGLLIVLALFGRLAIKTKNLNTLTAELSLFLIIWVVAELPRSFLMLGMISADPDLQFLGLVFHTISMIAFGVLIVYRFYRIRKVKY